MNVTLIDIIISIIGVILTVFIVPILKKRVDVSNSDLINKAIFTAVKAAEQLYSEPKQGDEKYEYVMRLLSDNKILDSLNERERSLLVEAAVFDISQKNGEKI